MNDMPDPMVLTLHSRVARIGNRNVQIVEVTRSEWWELRILRVVSLALGVALILGAFGFATLLGRCM